MAIIGSIRKRAGLAVAVVAIAILAFIFNDLFNKSNTLPSNIAKVNDNEINRNEFESTVQNIESNLMQQYQLDNLTPEQSFSAKQQAYTELLNDKLLEEQYELLGITVGKEEMNDMFFGDFIHPLVKQNFSDPQTGQYNRQYVQQYIAQFDKLPAEQQSSWKNFESYVKKSRSQEKYEKLLSKSMYMPKAIAAHLSNVYNQVTSSRYAVLNYSTITDNTIKLEEADYKKYYEEHKNEFKLFETVRDVEFVKFALTPSASDIKTINDSVISTFNMFQTIAQNDLASFVSTVSDRNYDSTYYKRADLSQLIPDSVLSKVNVGGYVNPFLNGNNWVMAKITAAQARPDSIRFARILILNNKVGGEIKRTQEAAKILSDSIFNIVKSNPAAFENNVAAFSDDPEGKKNFGDSGWILDGQMQSDLYNQVISTPINGVFVYNLPNEVGHMICKVTEKTAPTPKIQLATIVMEVRPSEKTINEIRDNANAFLGSASNMTFFTSEAQKKNLNVLTSTVRDMDFQLNGTPYAREIIRWVFNNDTKKGDVAPEVYELQDMFIVVGLKDIKEKGILTLEQAKPYIENMVRLEKKTDILMKKADALVKSSKTIEEVAAQINTTIDSAVNVSFSDPYFVQAGPEMRVIGTLSTVKKTGMQKPIRGFNGVYVVEVDQISSQLMKEDAGMIQQSFDMKNMQKTAQLRLPSQVLQERAKITNNFSFFY